MCLCDLCYEQSSFGQWSYVGWIEDLAVISEEVEAQLEWLEMCWAVGYLRRLVVIIRSRGSMIVHFELLHQYERCRRN
jgi:hypothetical protein